MLIDIVTKQTLTICDVSRMLGVSPSVVTQWCDSGEVSWTRNERNHILITTDDLLTFLEPRGDFTYDHDGYLHFTFRDKATAARKFNNFVTGSRQCRFDIVSHTNDYLIIRDLNQGQRSITNDADGLLERLADRGLLHGRPELIYRDSINCLDCIRYSFDESDHCKFEGFAPLTATDCDNIMCDMHDFYGQTGEKLPESFRWVLHLRRELVGDAPQIAAPPTITTSTGRRISIV